MTKNELAGEMMAFCAEETAKENYKDEHYSLNLKSKLAKMLVEMWDESVEKIIIQTGNLPNNLGARVSIHNGKREEVFTLLKPFDSGKKERVLVFL